MCRSHSRRALYKNEQIHRQRRRHNRHFGQAYRCKSTDVEETALATIKKVAKDKDMVSVYFGKDVTQEQADRLMQKVEQELDDVETACYYGGQPHYYYIISAE